MQTLEILYLRLIAALAAAGGVVFALTALLIPVNVVLRAGFQTSIFGLLDAVEYGLVATTFLAAPWVLARNAHVAVDIVAVHLPEAARGVIDRLVNILGAVLSAVLCWYAVKALGISFARGSVIRTAFAMPEWIPLIAPALAGFLLTLEFGRRLLRRPALGPRATTGL